MFIVFKRNVLVGILMIFCGTVFIAISLIKTDVFKASTLASGFTYTVVIDAGHGQPDGGAIASDGTQEEGLNLLVAQAICDILTNEGYDVVMTRADNNNVADLDKQHSIREIKISDIANRVSIINSSNADMLISIHMNKFSQSNSWGWQTFYKKGSEDSKLLAECIQSSISSCVDRQNSRQILSIKDVRIIDSAEIPAVVVECGFLSNPEDLKLLKTEEYRMEIAWGIARGVFSFYNFPNA